MNRSGEKGRRLPLLNSGIVILLLFCFTSQAIAAGDKPTLPDLKDTKITLDWNDFKALVENSYKSPAATVKPPAEAFLRSAEYRGKLQSGLLTMDGTLILEVLKKGWIRYPLWRQGTVVSFDGRGAYLRRNGDHVEVLAKGPGTFTLKARIVFGIPDQPGENSFSMTLPDAPQNLVDLVATNSIKDLEVPAGLAYAAGGNHRFISLTGGQATLRYTLPFHRTATTGGEEVKLEPRIHVMSYQLLDLGEGVMKGVLLLDYQVRVAKTDHFDVDLQKGLEVFDVSAPGMESWKILKRDSGRYLRVQLGTPAEGALRIVIKFEGSYDSEKGVLEVPRLEPLGVEREAGFVGVAAEGAEIKWALSGNLLPADPSELPSGVSGYAGNLVEVLKYSGKPDKAVVTVTEHEEAPVLTAIIERLNATTVVLDNGTDATWIDVIIRNNRKQFLKMKIPGKNVEIWSLLLDGEPAKPKLGGEEFLLPLPRGGGERATKVSLVLLRKGNGFPWLGSIKPCLPQFDVPISEAMWSLYMPRNHRYSPSEKNYRPVVPGAISAMSRALPSVTGSAQPQAERQMVQPQYYSKEIVTGQVQQEAKLKRRFKASASAARKGALPVRISIPGGVSALHKISVSRMLVVVGDDMMLKIFVYPQWLRALLIVFRIALLLFSCFLVCMLVAGKIKGFRRTGAALIILVNLVPWGGVGFFLALFLMAATGLFAWLGPKVYGMIKKLSGPGKGSGIEQKAD